MSQLKLAALDDEDLAIVSAHVQDAVIKVADLLYLSAERRFVVALNRFVWEKKRKLFARRHERRRSVLHFEGVQGVRTIGVRREEGDDVLSLLAIRFVPADQGPGGTIELTCSGGAAVRLDVDFIEARLTDLGAAWETTALPRHKA
jgi:hypothetical protein